MASSADSLRSLGKRWPFMWTGLGHTHTFNGPFSGTTGVSWYQKGKTNLDFTEARDSEWQWHQLGCMKVCTSLQRNNDANHHSVFYRPDALPATQPTASEHLRQQHWRPWTHDRKITKVLALKKCNVYILHKYLPSRGFNCVDDFWCLFWFTRELCLQCCSVAFQLNMLSHFVLDPDRRLLFTD